MSVPRSTAEEILDPSPVFVTCSGRHVRLPPLGDARADFSIRDIANHLSKTGYFSESQHLLPLTAAQYAVELAGIMRDAGPLAQLHALLSNAHEAYLGHRPRIARQAEMALHPRTIGEDCRDRLEQCVKEAIFDALEIPDLGHRQPDIGVLIAHASEMLDVTLERDIGACIDRSRERMADPLPRKITPQHCAKAIESYLRSYETLTVRCGLPMKG